MAKVKQRSLGSRWALRYTALIFLVIALLGFFVYRRSQALAFQDAQVLLITEAARLEKWLLEKTNNLPEVISHTQSTAPPDLKLSIRVFDADGHLLHENIHPDLPLSPFDTSMLINHMAQSFREVRGGKKKYPYWVLTSRAESGHFVQVSIYGRDFIRRARRIRYTLLVALPLAVLGAGGVGIALSRTSLKPVAVILSSLKGITGERLEDRIPTQGTGDEFDQIAVSINGVLDRIQLAMETLKRFSLNAAHQLRSPLTALRGRIEVALETNLDPLESRKLLQNLLGDVTRIADMLDAMLSLSRSSAGLSPAQRSSVELGSLLDSVISFFQPMAREENKTLKRIDENTATVLGDTTWLQQLFVNLVDNALRYTETGGTISLALECEDARVCVRVTDSGRGIPASAIETIFEPFHRVEPSGDVTGVGLGLPLARQIAVIHGGSLHVESKLGEGSTFSVHLPLQLARS